MEQSTDFRNPSVRSDAVRVEAGLARRVLRAAGRFFHAAIFWTYARGSWQYDVICAVILAFIFLTPASWYHDQPTLGLTNLRRTQGIIDVGHAKDGWHYIVDARLVDSLAPLSPQAAVGEILTRRTHRPVVVESIVAMRGQDNVILGYTVIVKR